ncbi:hypothetical protein K440DRAFT_641505 [Wilcoxina mikolae CBS 423.85]|nr:hypothetical protein K440DRAFT_641505 [Wilcoxina mikolae CBS 423.85]
MGNKKTIGILHLIVASLPLLLNVGSLCDMEEIKLLYVDRDQYISALNRHIAADGKNSDNANWAPDEVISPTVGGQHSTATEKRMNELEDLKQREGFLTDDDSVNLHAVLEAYHTGALTAHPTKVSYWWVGTNKTGWIDEGTIDLARMVRIWKDESGGEGRLWIEMMARNQMAAHATFAAINGHAHHQFFITLRMAGVAGAPEIDLLCLDDTGSSLTDIYTADDDVFLGLTPAYPGLAGPILLNTANGPVSRMSANMELNLKDFAGVYMGRWVQGLCTCLPGFSFGPILLG